MKNMQGNIKNSGLLRLVVLFAIIFTTHIFPMIQPKSQREMSQRLLKGYMKSKVQPKQVSEQQQKKELEEAFMSDEELKAKRGEYPDKYFIHVSDNSSEGILVDKEVVKNTSKTLKNIIEDFGGEISAIPIPSSVYTIKLAFDILEKYNALGEKHIKEISLEQLSEEIDINYLSFQELIDIANLFNYLEVPAKALSLVLNAIEITIKRNNEKIVELRQLHPDLQKTLMLNSVVDYLKDFIINKYAKYRKQLLLIGHPVDVNSVAFSPNGDYIVSGGFGNKDNLILWDVSNPSNITHQELAGHPNNVTSVAFSSDGTKIVSGCKGNQNNLLLWDINDLENPKPLIGHPAGVYSVAFSPDGTKVVSGCWGNQNNLILWDISNPTNITHKVLIGHLDSVISVAFSSDGTKIVSGCEGNQNNLLLWDINDLENPKPLIGHTKNVHSVAFSPDGTKIVSGSFGKQNNLILWDISNPTNITHQPLVGHPYNVYSVAFSPDGTKIASGSWSFWNNLILWDISNPINITHLFLGQTFGVRRVAFSPDGTKILLVGEDKKSESKLMLLPLLTDQEEMLLKKLKNYNADQVRLIYMFCLKALKGKTVSLKSDSEEQNIFMTLPENMQKLLKDLFFTQGWFSGWW